MLKKENRLKSNRAFSATYKNNNVVKSDLIVLYIGRIKFDKNCPTRVGFVVSKKVHKRAVKRNKIKRLMRENIRLILKKDESVINLSGKKDTLKVFGYGKPGTYRISVYINNQIIRAFDGEYYCDAEVKKGQKFQIDIPVEAESEKNHIYVVVLELSGDSDVTNNYIKSNTKLLLVN